MANTYQLRVNSLDAYTNQNGLENVIYNVHWSYIARDENDNVGIRNGVQSIADPDPENFTPYESLSAEDVISWVEPLLDLESLKSDVDHQISEKVSPTRVTLYIASADDQTDLESTASESEETV
jgi:hypothetical protein